MNCGWFEGELSSFIRIAMNASNGTDAFSVLRILVQELEVSQAFSPAMESLVLFSFILVLALDVLILLAFARDSATDKMVRLVFGNIVLASLIVCILSFVGHIMSLALPLWSTGEIVYFCKLMIVLAVATGTGRMLFSLAYAVLVLLVIRFWDKPILSPKNVKYFIIVVVALWCVAILGAVPLMFDDLNSFCALTKNGQNSVGPYLFIGTHDILFAIVPMIISIAAVTASLCYTKRYIIRRKSATIKPIVRFAIFVILDQAVILLGQVGVITSIATDSYIVHVTVSAVVGLSLIASPILIIALVGTTRRKILSWFCCCNKSCTT